MDNQRLRMVVVDDSQPVRQRVIKALLACGPIDCVGEAESVASAIDAVARLDPDVLILDLHLIGGTGLDVLRALQSAQSRVRVAVLTSFANDQYRKACMRAGAEQVFDKLTEFDQLVELVRKWSQSASASRACSAGPA